MLIFGWLVVLASAPLTLEEAVAIAQANARDVVKAKADLVLVDVERARALAAVLPRLDLTTGVGANVLVEPIIEARAPRLHGDAQPFTDYYVTDTYADPFFRNTLAMRQLVYDGGRWWTVMDRAGDIEAQRRALLRSIENNLRLQVARNFYDYESARRSVMAFDVRVRSGIAQLARAKALLESGQGSAQNVATSERNLNDDKLTLARRVFAARRVGRAFNLALARAPDTPVELTLPIEVRTASAAAPIGKLPTQYEAERAAELHRPDLNAARATLEILRKNVTIVGNDYWPNVSVGATYQRASRRVGRGFGDPLDNFVSVFDVTLRWNLFRGLGTNADVEEAELQIVKATADYQELERQVMAEVQDRLENLDLQVHSYTLAARSLRSAGDAVALARALFAQGKNTALELRDAENAFTVAELAAIDVRFDLELAREDLRRVVGIDLVEAR